MGKVGKSTVARSVHLLACLFVGNGHALKEGRKAKNWSVADGKGEMVKPSRILDMHTS